MSQVTAIISRIFMNSDYNVMFYDQYDNLVQTIETATFVEVVGTYLVCGDGEGNSCKFFANTVTLIEGPTFSQSYTPIPAGFYQQDQAYFNRLSEMYTYINTNVVNVVIRWIDALKFADGTTQTTAAGGGGGSGTVTSVGFTAGTGITLGGTNPITTSGSVTITNSAPDQVVTLTEGAGIDITGTYPNFTIASTVDGGILHGTTSGTDTYTTTITGVTGYNDADAYLIRFAIGNTGVSTLNINSLGAIPLYRNNDGQLIGGDIIDGAEMLCIYNSSTNRFQVIGTAPNTLLAYVTNADSVAITKGQPVYAFGGQGDRLTVKLAYNTGDLTSAQTVGLVVSTSIGVNQKGLIMVNGLLDGLSIFPTSTWADGDPVYLGPTPGSITKTKPYAPNHLVYLGFVTRANNGSAGSIYIRVQNGYELDELHNVDARNPNDKDGLFYNTSTSLWENRSIAAILGYTPGQGTVTSIATTSPILGGPITTSGTISIQQADSSKGGYLSSADWNTFNNKGNGTVTSVSGTGSSAGLTLSGSVTTSGSLTLSGTLSTPVSTINDSTTVGQNLVKLTNPSAVTFLRVNADNTVSSLDAATFRTAIGAGTSSTNGTVTSVSALTLGTSGTDLNSSVATGTTTPVITLNVPTASATNRGVLSSTDWSTFNGKQNTISLTTTGTSGAATLVGSTLNIPQYSSGSGSSTSVWGFNLANSIAASTTTWVGIGVLNGTLETTSNFVIPVACTLSDMYLIHYVNGQPATGSQVITVRKNGVDTALTITIAAGSAATPNSNYYNGSSVSFAAGDRLSIRRVNNATSVSGSINGLSFKMVI